MNVMLVVPWDQRFGGVASVVGHLATRLEKLGHRVIFLYPGNPEKATARTTAWGMSGYEIKLRPPFISGRPLKSLLAFLVFFPLTMYRLLSLVRTHGIQIVNIHYPVDAFVYFAVLRRLVSIRLVLSVHGADLFPDGRPWRRYPRSLGLLISAADALVAPSRAFLDDTLGVFPAAARKAVVVHNGVDLDELQRSDGTMATEQWKPYILCIAAHNEKKAIDVLLKAFARLMSGPRGLRLLLVGDGPLRPQLEALARSLGLEDRVAFLGSRERADVARLLQDCTLLVLPSRSEPFGIVVAEALACRKPVVASAVGGIPEIIESGRTGVLVEPDDPDALAEALARVLESEALRESIAEAGHRRVRDQFGCDAMSARYVQVYAGLLAGGASLG
jgi:glycosyltransferase involved in cell wall biosynthesis